MESSCAAVLATTSTILVKASSPRIKAATATSLAALKTAGNPPPREPQCRARLIDGNLFSSMGAKFHVCVAVQSTGEVAFAVL